MRACSFICIISVAFLIIDQFYNGLNWERLFIVGLILVAIWTDCGRWVRYKLKEAQKHSNNDLP